MAIRHTEKTQTPFQGPNARLNGIPAFLKQKFTMLVLLSASISPTGKALLSGLGASASGSLGQESSFHSCLLIPQLKIYL